MVVWTDACGKDVHSDRMVLKGRDERERVGDPMLTRVKALTSRISGKGKGKHTRNHQSRVKKGERERKGGRERGVKEEEDRETRQRTKGERMRRGWSGPEGQGSLILSPLLAGWPNQSLLGDRIRRAAVDTHTHVDAHIERERGHRVSQGRARTHIQVLCLKDRRESMREDGEGDALYTRMPFHWGTQKLEKGDDYFTYLCH
ncbi:hypothetical protein BJ684DRAFT_15260 [Piptocephalis cylindrospora]|uniref:Uncharacterized protein n=1 Tax=Piptocephalis cylindrospora TaxID=1907219 RepID=A0A4P9Y5V0_9FUNG|nr:hypothetical protein BJ684DRAFT_15260 [Piptocephalis cylindrospora]|eukprot:RKP14416.1 hypothetical protein BJ684DRAFT_15260 [Piptocephalis cylindrospora]